MADFEAVVDFFSSQHQPQHLPVFRSLCNALKAAVIDYGLELWGRHLHTPRLQVLDVGCGRGGDLWKWTKNRPKTFIGLDASLTCVDEARSRFSSLVSRGRSNMSASFHLCDARRQPFPVETATVDIVSCQFALQFFLGSMDHATHFFSEVARCLKPHGVFLAVLPDGDRVHRILEKGDNLLGHFTVARTERTNLLADPPVGIEYAFSLTQGVACAEFLASPRFLHAALSGAGLEPALEDGRFTCGAQSFMSSGIASASVQAVLKEQRCSVQDWRSLGLFRVLACRKPGAPETLTPPPAVLPAARLQRRRPPNPPCQT